MNYSTLKEVYNVDTFEKEKEKKKKKKIKYDDTDEISSVSSLNLNNNMKQEKQSLNITNDIDTSQIKTLNLQPYYDEELEKYLTVNEPKPLQNNSLNSQNISIPVITPTTLQTSVISDIKPTNESITKNNTKLDNFYKNIINIGLFVFIGVLIIFLCDQITEIAINIGMKKTMLIMEKYLSEAHIVKDK